MKRSVFSAILLTFLALSVPFFAAMQQPVEASQTIICDKLPSGTGGEPGPREECLRDSEASFGDFVGSVIGVLSWIVGAVSVLVLLIAGFMYVVSAGSPERAKQAKNTILYALVGLGVAFAAQMIVQFVLSSV